MSRIGAPYSANLNNTNYINHVGGIKPSPFAVFNGITEANTSDSFETKNKKVTFKEGAHLFFQGVTGRMKELGKEITKHPIRTALVAGGTMAALSLLPLVGITVGTGSAIIAGAIALKTGFSMAGDVVNINKCRKNGDNSALRKYIKKLGSDSFDMALVAPIIPKGIKQLRSQVKAGEAFKLNSELLAKIKTQKVYKSAIDLMSTNSDMLLRQFGDKAPWYIKLFAKIKPNINLEMATNINNGVQSASQSIGCTISSGVILAKMAKEMGLNDEYCEKAEERFNESMKNNTSFRIIDAIAKTNSNYTGF